MKRACMAIFASTFLTLAIGTPPTALAEPGNVALELEKAFTDVAEMAFPAVVVITNKRVDRRPLYPEMDIPPELRYFFGLPPPQRPRSRREAERPKVPQPAGKGSGIIIRADGFVLTWT